MDHPARVLEEFADNNLTAPQMAGITCEVLDYLHGVFLQDMRFLYDACGNSLSSFPLANLLVLQTYEYQTFLAERNQFYIHLAPAEERAPVNPRQEPTPVETSETIFEVEQSPSQRAASTNTPDIEVITEDVTNMNKDMEEIKAGMAEIKQNLAQLMQSLTKDGVLPGVSRPGPALDGFSFLPRPRTFRQIWEEYAVPRDGAPAVRQLDERYGATWRRSGPLTKTYFRRKPVWEAVKKGLARDYTVDQCLNIPESERRRLGHIVSTFMDLRVIPMALIDGVPPTSDAEPSD